MASGDLAFQVRATLPTGERLKVGPFATEQEARERAQRLFGVVHASRVETLRHVGDEWQLLGVIGWPMPALGPAARRSTPAAVVALLTAARRMPR